MAGVALRWRLSWGAVCSSSAHAQPAGGAAMTASAPGTPWRGSCTQCSRPSAGQRGDRTLAAGLSWAVHGRTHEDQAGGQLQVTPAALGPHLGEGPRPLKGTGLCPSFCPSSAQSPPQRALPPRQAPEVLSLFSFCHLYVGCCHRRPGLSVLFASCPSVS